VSDAVRLLATLVVAVSALWGGMALWYQVSAGSALRSLSAALWAAFSFAVLLALWRGWAELGLPAFAAAFVGLLLWWRRLLPSNDRIWADDVAQMAR